ncbi:hypothetical protein AAFC00_004560 [Neodothiora populina]
MTKGRGFLPRTGFFAKGKYPEEAPDDSKYFDPDEDDETTLTRTTTSDTIVKAEQLSAQEPDLRQFNDALRVLVDVFPDVEPEVFREMLVNLSQESRLEVVTEHLLRDGVKFVQGRYRRRNNAAAAATAKEEDRKPREEKALRQEDTFRSEEYKAAVKLAFYQEFKSLSHSAIRAVLAEHNYSYTLSRPTLQQIHSRSWRATITNFWTRKRGNTLEAESHPLIEWQPDLTGSGRVLPCLNRTKSHELNRELYATFVAPLLAASKDELFRRDQALADELNEAEATEAQALYDCECCYSSTTFEQIATCDDGCHYVCFTCIRHTTNEALYGQGWARSVDLGKASLRCLAPALDECQGCIPAQLVKRALFTTKEGQHTWHTFQDRVASETMTKSRLPLLKCPFCPYAELDELPSISFRDPITVIFQQAGHIPHDPYIALGVLVFLLLYPILFLLLPITLIIIILTSKAFHARLRSSQARVLHKRRGLKFTCLSPSCQRLSCTNCHAAWQDPHSCFSSDSPTSGDPSSSNSQPTSPLQSLRHAIETATTQSIKRTCPKCNLSFIKSSGCNKLVCRCGYTMCYICRCEISHREGYSHFCQHFRDRPGTRCQECDKCDLYVAENEDDILKSAAKEAEIKWLEGEKERLGGDNAVERDRHVYGGVVRDVLRGGVAGSSSSRRGGGGTASGGGRAGRGAVGRRQQGRGGAGQRNWTWELDFLLDVFFETCLV